MLQCSAVPRKRQFFHIYHRFFNLENTVQPRMDTDAKLLQKISGSPEG
jgi:hypothetical protein